MSVETRPKITTDVENLSAISLSEPMLPIGVDMSMVGSPCMMCMMLIITDMIAATMGKIAMHAPTCQIFDMMAFSFSASFTTLRLIISS